MTPTPEGSKNGIARSLIFAAIILSLLIAGFVLAEKSGVTDLILNMDTLIVYMQSLGAGGPFVVIGLMILAIVFNPLPSAPIALASGAVYGHL